MSIYKYVYMYIIRVKFSIKRLTTPSVRPNYTNKLMLKSACALSSTKSAILKCIIPVVFKCAKERRILVSHNTTVYMC